MAEAALRALLRGQSIHGLDRAMKNLAPRRPGKVSLPESARCSRFEDIASPEGRSFLDEDHERMKLEPEMVD